MQYNLVENTCSSSKKMRNGCLSENISQKEFSSKSSKVNIIPRKSPAKIIIYVRYDVLEGTGFLLTEKQFTSQVKLEQAIREEIKISSIKMQIDAVRQEMGLNISEISSILGVSRQAIYDWMEPDTKLRREHQEKLDALSKICLYWSTRKKLVAYRFICIKTLSKVNASLFSIYYKMISLKINISTLY